MTAKEWLNRGWRIDKTIKGIREEMREAQDALYGVSAVWFDGERVQGGKRRLTEDVIVTLADYQQELNQELIQLIRTKQEIFKVIRQVRDHRLRPILIRRYLRFETWEEIAQNVGVDVTTVYRRHKRALNLVVKILKDADFF